MNDPTNTELHGWVSGSYQVVVMLAVIISAWAGKFAAKVKARKDNATAERYFDGRLLAEARV